MGCGANFLWLKGDKVIATYACSDAANPVVLDVHQMRDS